MTRPVFLKIPELLLFCFCAQALLSCTSPPTRSNDLNDQGRPNWVSFGSGPMQSVQGRLFQGVGSAPLQGRVAQQSFVAERQARQALQQALLSFLQVVSRDYIANEVAQRRRYAQQQAQEDVRRIVERSGNTPPIVGYWSDPTKQRFYAVAEIKSSNLKATVEQSSQIDPGFKRYFLSQSDFIFDRLAGNLD
ncbi:MAG: hypothetical protein OEZ68_13970 [Gammaproteobacteria bacterium]|nr:hypothetical protein [Gammaproteobacteria bacterium]MDH5801909.1 hypothetical protein [Gammaproteobacteria bacterium]